MDVELEYLRNQAVLGDVSSQINYLSALRVRISSLIQDPSKIFQRMLEQASGSQLTRFLPWEDVETILKVEGNTPENRNIVHSFYEEYFPRERVCSCENSYCRFCQGGNCVQFVDMSSWIEWLGPFCPGCALEMPIRYHGDYDFLNYLTTGTAGSVCRCRLCLDLTIQARNVLQFRSPNLEITFINPTSMNSKAEEHQSIQIGTRVPQRWVYGLLPPAITRMGMPDQLFLADPKYQPRSPESPPSVEPWGHQHPYGFLHLSTISNRSFTRQDTVPAIIVLHKWNHLNGRIWKVLPELPEPRSNPEDSEIPWNYGYEEDEFGVPHGRSRKVPCPQCGTLSREAECFDVGGHWIFCPKCSLIDII